MPATETSPRAVVVIPGKVNYFYNQSGRRIAEALRTLGVETDVCTLAECPDRSYEWGVVSNIAEVLHGFGDKEAGAERVCSLARRCRTITCCAIDCVSTPWYENLCHLCERCEIGTILDLGLYDQNLSLGLKQFPKYQFVFSGLTPSEARAFQSLDRASEERPLPWAFVGHLTPYRAALVDFLIQEVNSRGFVYMPHLAPYTEKGSPHLNQQQFEAVLRRSRYQVWSSHHHHFYMEPERFRASLLTGSVPVKVVGSREGLPPDVPFRYLVVHANEVASRLRDGNFLRVRHHFWQDWLRLPTLEEEFARVIGVSAVGPRALAA